MPNQILIPAAAGEMMREGVRSQIMIAAQLIVDAGASTSACEHAERDPDPLLRIDALRAMMRELDSNPTEPGADLWLDPRAHGWILTKLLADEIASHRDMLRDHDPDDAGHSDLSNGMDTLVAISLELLLRLQSELLHPAKPRLLGQDGAYPGFP